jgi:hypothetical protein
MKHPRKLLILVLLVVNIVITLYNDAYAYLDPGTGSFIFQIVLAALLAALATVKFWWKRVILAISGFFSKFKKSKIE